jgi:predicted ATP-dependent serine protease
MQRYVCSNCGRKGDRGTCQNCGSSDVYPERRAMNTCVAKVDAQGTLCGKPCEINETLCPEHVEQENHIQMQ